MSKTVIVSEYFYPRDRPDSYFMTEISRVISDTSSGNIQIICNSDLNEAEELDFVQGNITRLRENALNKDKLLQRIAKFIISTFKLGIAAFSSLKSGDRLFTVTNPAFLLVVFALFKKIKTFHYTLLVYDVFPENLIAAGLTKKHSILYKITKKVFDWAYAQADLLVVIGRDMQELITEKTHGQVPTVLIPNWCDVDTIVPSSKNGNPIIRKFDLETSTVFAFTGNFGRAQGIETLLKAASLVTRKDFKLLFIGEGAMRPMIEKHIRENPEGNVIYAGSYPAAEHNLFLNACDVAVVSLGDNMYGLGVPSKSYNNMAAEKPLFFIGHQQSEIARIIREEQIGWSCSSADIQDISAMIEYICDHTNDCAAFGRKARQIAEENFSKQVVLQQYFNLYKGFK